jgi:NAD(P)-dependent dehydrogenase (short-subunit alcohol dehydrogenase family)
MNFSGKTVLITGAAGGIGEGCARAFAVDGAHVVVADRNVEAGQRVAADIQQLGGTAAFIAVDLSIPAQVEVLVDQTVSMFGGLDVLISNAGLGGRSLGDGPVHECTVEAWDTIIDVNLRGTFLACKYAIPYLLERRGNIITMASVLGMVGTQGLYDTHAYATSKAGIIGLTRTIAVHYAKQGLRANTIAPGLVDTRMATRTKATPQMLEQIDFWQPLGGIGAVDDVVQAALFLASDRAKFITGVVLPIDGGWTAQ